MTHRHNIHIIYLGFLFVISILCILPYGAQAQSYGDNIDDIHINQIASDSEGVLWFGTDLGLFSYNGSIFTKYSKQNTPVGFFSNHIRSLFIDKEDNVWVGSNFGVNKIVNGVYVKMEKTFSDVVYGLTPYDENNLIFSSVNGLYLFDKNTHETNLVYDSGKNYFSPILYTNGEYTWTVPDNSPVLCRIIGPDFNHYKDLYPRIKGQDVIISSVTGHNGDVFVCTNRGVSRYTLKGEQLDLKPALREITQGENVLLGKWVSSRGKYLFSIQNKGFILYDSLLDIVEYIHPFESLMTNDEILCELTENHLIYSENGNGFKTYLLSPANTILKLDLKSSEWIQNVYPTEIPSVIQVVTNYSIYSLDIKSGAFKSILSDKSVAEKILVNPFKDSKGNFWITDKRNVLNKFCPSESGDYHLEKSFDVEYDNIHLWEDSEGKINWIYNGVHHYIDLNYKVSETSVSNGNGGLVYFNDKGELYSYGISSPDIYKKDNSSDVFSLIKTGLESSVSALYQDSMDRLWIGTYDKGLYIYDLNSGEKIHMGVTEGISDGHILNIMSSDKGDMVWVTTLHNLYRIRTDDLKLTELDGDFAFTPTYFPGGGTYTKDIDGNTVFVFNAMKSVNVVIPALDKNPSIPHRLVLSHYLLDNQMIEAENSLIISPSVSSVSFLFSSTYYGGGPAPNYSWKLDGYDKDWSTPSPNHIAEYSSLPKGKYTFRVKVQDPDGSWWDESLDFPVVKTPAFFERDLVKLCLFIIIAALAYLSVNALRIKRNRKLEVIKQQTERTIMEKNIKERMNFLSNISHEYRTPLSLIYGPVKTLLSRGTIAEKQDQDLLEMIERNTSRMLGLTERMIDLDKAEGEIEKLYVQKVNISDLIHEVQKSYSILLEEKEMEVNLVIPENPPLQGFMDQGKVETILSNLLSNAIKYTPKRGSITIEADVIPSRTVALLYPDQDTTCPGEYVEICVRDTGIGIPHDKIDKIFKRFERVMREVENGTIPEGFGVGLNYVYFLVKKHKGLMKVESDGFVGSRFSFAIPIGQDAYIDSEKILSVQNEEQKDDAFYAQILVPENMDSVQILVVDDNPDIRQYLESVFDNICPVRKAADGVQAMDAIYQSMPDVIICDVMMPYMDGIELCNKLKNDDAYCHIPIILLTAKADIQGSISGLSVGADAYIPKPFDPDVLKATVFGVINNRKRTEKALASKTNTRQLYKGIIESAAIKDQAFLDKVYGIIDENISDENYSLKQLATSMNMSYSAFYQKVKSLLGSTPQELLISYRLNRAMELLKEHNLNVSEVCYKVGFSSLPGFSRSFKNQFGVPPSAI